MLSSWSMMNRRGERRATRCLTCWKVSIAGETRRGIEIQSCTQTGKWTEQEIIELVREQKLALHQGIS
eukprot:498029-Hanusia_phi.AAC.1